MKSKLEFSKHKGWVGYIVILILIVGCSDSEPRAGRYFLNTDDSKWAIYVDSTLTFQGNVRVRGGGGENLVGTISTDGELIFGNPDYVSVTGHADGNHIKLVLKENNRSFLLIREDEEKAAIEKADLHTQHVKDRFQDFVTDFNKSLTERGYHQKWQCPMNCSGGDKAAVCPVCRMDYLKNPNWKAYKAKVDAGKNPITGETINEAFESYIEGMTEEDVKIIREEFNKLY